MDSEKIADAIKAAGWYIAIAIVIGFQYHACMTMGH